MINRKTNNILVPIDFTEDSSVGLASAIDIATLIDAKISLLHVVNEPSRSGFRPDGDLVAKSRKDNDHGHFMAELIRKRNQQLVDLTKNYDATHIEFISTIEFGDFEEALHNFLDKNTIDLIVMGTSGETNLSEWYTGNHVAQAIRIADVPVLSLKHYHSFSSESNLLLLVDLKKYNKGVVKTIRNFAHLLHMNVQILHIKEADNIAMSEAMAWMNNFAEENQFEKYTLRLVDEDNKIEQIKKFSSNLSIDIVASISEGEAGFARLLYGNDTENMINELSDPVLAVSH
jgi:nucleotide-binding universal stress UspA family protein